MSELQIRQGTVYLENATGKKMLLIHHDPMNLRSMVVIAENDTFDCVHPGLISIDDLISIRKSGFYRELGDVPSEVFQQIVKTILEYASGLDENTVKLLNALLPSGETK